MDNYKIKVKDEAVFAEAVALCEQISGKSFPYPNIGCDPDLWIFIGPEGAFGWSLDLDHSWSGLDLKELTLPQLRDLVVLKRNDINDATHTDEDRRAYLDSEGMYHFYIHAEHKWEHSLDVQYVGKYLKPINKPQDPALISGAEALADITKVQHAYNCSDDWFTTQYSTLTIPEILKGKTNCGHEIKFRVKPTTITINTELPKPEREFHQNTEIFSVTYEFKTREERNAFARKLRGTNS